MLAPASANGPAARDGNGRSRGVAPVPAAAFHRADPGGGQPPARPVATAGTASSVEAVR
jgi:hypothetical protein